MSSGQNAGNHLPPSDDHIQHLLTAIEDGQPKRTYLTQEEKLARIPGPTFPEGYDPANPVKAKVDTQMADGVMINDHVALARVWDKAGRGDPTPDALVNRELPKGKVQKLLGRIGIGR